MLSNLFLLAQLLWWCSEREIFWVDFTFFCFFTSGGSSELVTTTSFNSTPASSKTFTAFILLGTPIDSAWIFWNQQKPKFFTWIFSCQLTSPSGLTFNWILQPSPIPGGPCPGIVNSIQAPWAWIIPWIKTDLTWHCQITALIYLQFHSGALGLRGRVGEFKLWISPKYSFKSSFKPAVK